MVSRAIKIQELVLYGGCACIKCGYAAAISTPSDKVPDSANIFKFYLENRKPQFAPE